MAAADETPSLAVPDIAPEWQARLLLRAARVASLGSSADGQPFVSLVTPACAPDLSVLMLLSDLSEHTRHLKADPRCSLLVSGPPTGPNPQTAPRLTVTGLAEPIDDAALKARWLAIHPYAALYAGFADFRLWRLAPAGGLMVGGFARATRLRAAALAPDPGALEAVAAAEAGVIAHCNADHADAMALIARAAGGRAEAWRMVTADVDGCDLAPEGEEPVLRVAWSAPVSDSGGIRKELVRMTRAIRAQAAV